MMCTLLRLMSISFDHDLSFLFFLDLDDDDGFVSVIEWSYETERAAFAVILTFICSFAFLFVLIMCTNLFESLRDKSDDRSCCARNYSLFSQIIEEEEENRHNTRVFLGREMRGNQI